MRIPTVHMNGTSPEQLMEPLLRAHRAIEEALDALAAASPNGRDYYPQGDDALREAQQEHRSRAERLRSVQEELMEIAVAVQDQADERGVRENPRMSMRSAELYYGRDTPAKSAGKKKSAKKPQLTHFEKYWLPRAFPVLLHEWEKGLLENATLSKVIEDMDDSTFREIAEGSGYIDWEALVSIPLAKKVVAWYERKPLTQGEMSRLDSIVMSLNESLMDGEPLPDSLREEDLYAPEKDARTARKILAHASAVGIRENPSSPRTQYLFCYGSNSTRQLEDRLGIPGGSRGSVQGAYAPDYQRVFRGMSRTWGGGTASLKKKKGATTYGLIVELSPRDLKVLDRYEGVHSGVYKRQKMIVYTQEGEPVEAIAYVSLKKDFNPPTEEYLDAVARTISRFWEGENGPVTADDIPIR